MKKGTIIIALVGILAIAGIAAYSVYMGNRSINQDRFSVSGSGTVYAKADIANITVGLRTDVKKTAAEATKESTEKMNAIISSIKDLGIEEKDIKTTDYSLNPIYNWIDGRGQVLQGYQVSQNVSVKVRDLDKIGDVIAKTTEQGANQIGNVSFTIDDEYDLKNQARELAIQKAKEKAAMMAEQTGMKLGRIKGVYESADIATPVPMYANAKLMLDESAAGLSLESANIQTGQNEIRVEVTLTYEVK
ncbi:MAG: SIMPL domain-containing protein [Patescibacteria group bacterium]|nr:SIMPL domain-containing protein [Patescibacteria group bacterium]